jgi:hypothetical protein
MSVVLSALSTGAAVAAYYAENRGNLWLAAAAGPALALPYYLLIMSPAGSRPVQSHAPQTATAPMQQQVLSHQVSETPTVYEDDVGGLEMGSAVSDELLGSIMPSHAARQDGTASHPTPPTRLLVSKSGMLVSPQTYAGWWSQKYWFGAVLSGAAFAAMMSMVGSGRDAATYANTPE